MCLIVQRGMGSRELGACCGRTRLVQQDAGRSPQDTLNAAETEGRVLVDPLSVCAKGSVPRGKD